MATAKLHLLGWMSALLLLLFCSSLQAQSLNFEAWSNLARSQPLSPVSAAKQDHQVEWVAPDGQKIRLVVREPLATNRQSIQVDPVAQGEDATPVFSKAVDALRHSGAHRLIIPPGRYEFKTLDKAGLAHWALTGLTDVTVEGSGAILVFSQVKTGIYLADNRRVKLENVTLDYDMPLASLGKIVAVNGVNKLILAAGSQLSGTERVRYVAEFNPAQGKWVAGGPRLIFPDGGANEPVLTSERTYESPAFKQISAEHDVIVLHHFYGAEAVLIKDIAGQGESEDVVINNITLQGSPGMGIVAIKLKRGLAILNCKIVPKKNGRNAVSAEYDAIHVGIIGGDVLISGNIISGQGDDAINLSSPVFQILGQSADGMALDLNAYGRYIRKGDHLVFFRPDAAVAATALVLEDARIGQPGKSSVRLDQSINGLDAKWLVRDFELLSSRFAILGNDISRCNCHAILAQTPNGLISDNHISDTKYNAIRLITNLWQWKEGAGAFNVRVEKNIIANGGGDNSLKFPFGAISLYGVGAGGISTQSTNDHILIANNDISHVAQACISVSNSQNVEVTGNNCRAVNQSATAGAAAFSDPGRVAKYRDNRLDGALQNE